MSVNEDYGLAQRMSEDGDRDWADALVAQECPDGRHMTWFADVAGYFACPWCVIDGLRAAVTFEETG